MKKLLLAACVSTSLLGACATSMDTPMGMSSTMPMAAPMVGGAAMYPSKDIIDKAAGLVDTLKGAGPFTVFAPTNAAFAALPAGTVDTLLKPENKKMLTHVLTEHVVAGRVDSAALGQMIRAGNGRAMLKTVSGDTLVATMSGQNVLITDAKGGSATVTIADVYQSNGVIHVVNKVLLPG
jgi:uncharacterized surface protein with fasciclin (FAS1) repeats